MKEYIEREAVLGYPIRKDHYDREHGNEHFVFGIESVIEFVENLPAADVAPVRHGRWIGEPVDIDGHTAMECSECHKIRLLDEYCSSCGARMDKEAAHD